MLPQAPYFGPKAQEGGGAKIRSERSHDGVANEAEGICRFPAQDVPFASTILGIFTVNYPSLEVSPR